MSSSSPSQSVLLLGSGLVAPPLVKYLVSHGIRVTVASRTVAKADAITANLDKSLTATVAFDIERKEAIEQLEVLTQAHDLVISLLPYVFHCQAARVAIKYKKHFCTTSYVSDEMAGLDGEAKAAGVILLNECGVDPGLDHMSAQRVIDEVHAKGGKVKAFYSVTGGLPAPSANNNPLGYKLSWSPRGVLLASRNDAQYLEQGREVVVKGTELYSAGVHRHESFGGDIGDLEWYFNRNSIKYRDTYSIPEVETIIRGTYRNMGWCAFMSKVAGHGFTSMDDMQPPIGGRPYPEFVRALLNLGNTANVRDACARTLGVDTDGGVMEKLEWLGLFDAAQLVPPAVTSALDALCHLFQAKMVYSDGEKDMIVMRHTFEVEYASSCARETITSTMINYGLQPDGDSSMARTVSLPVAVAVRHILAGTIAMTGVRVPVVPELYTPILDEMSTLGVCFDEHKPGTHLWVRHEVKPGEERVPLTPTAAKELLAAGFRVTVERSPTRCIPDQAFADAGCTMALTGSWPQAPHSAVIFGLKELPESKEPLVHRHVYFAHCYKQQAGWRDLLARFRAGGGMLWDLEFLVNDAGRRVAAFGRPAGLVGMALALYQWACRQTGAQLPSPLRSWASTQALVDEVSGALKAAEAKCGRMPSSLVLGALGRSGGGAVWFAEQCGLQPEKWDLAETGGGGPFPRLAQVDVLVNCIYLMDKIPAFLTRDMATSSDPARKLSVFCDVSCDTSNPNNPFPFSDRGTTLFDPVYRVDGGGGGMHVDVIAIDHLPSLLPCESSDIYSHDLLPTLRTIDRPTDQGVWARAADLFEKKLLAAAAPQE